MKTRRTAAGHVPARLTATVLVVIVVGVAASDGAAIHAAEHALDLLLHVVLITIAVLAGVSIAGVLPGAPCAPYTTDTALDRTSGPHASPRSSARRRGACSAAACPAAAADVRGAAGAEEAEPDAGAGKRDPAPGGSVLRPGDLPKMTYPLVLDLAADSIPVAVTCRMLGFSKQAFYTWKPIPSAEGTGTTRT
jgi:hypothetical protein